MCPAPPPAPPSLLGPHSVVARMVSLSPLAAPLALLLWRLSPLSEIICPLCVCPAQGSLRGACPNPFRVVGEGEAAATYTKSVRPSSCLSGRPAVSGRRTQSKCGRIFKRVQVSGVRAGGQLRDGRHTLVSRAIELNCSAPPSLTLSFRFGRNGRVVAQSAATYI